VDIGVFIPIGNNGWLISTTSPQYLPSFDLNRRIVQKAEGYGLDFALSMIKLRGFGGASQFWDYNLESFTLMAGLASVTARIKLYASVGTLTIPPALTARMAVTIDSIARGRFGINIVTGWQRAEYEQMGLWPGEEHYARRYDHASEYVHIMRELWETGRSDFHGSFFKMNDCRLLPLPQAPIHIICAGQSERGMRFTAEYGDYNFFQGAGLNTPTAHAHNNAKLISEAARSGRDVGCCILFMVIADETDDAAMAKWRHYNDGIDQEAVGWMMAQALADKSAPASASARKKALPERPINLNMGTLVGSYASIARMLDEAASVPGTKGLMLCFDDFLEGLDQFGERVQPLMRSRSAVPENANQNIPLTR
jgi:pyrimidine oxygenase